MRKTRGRGGRRERGKMWGEGEEEEEKERGRGGRGGWQIKRENGMKQGFEKDIHMIHLITMNTSSLKTFFKQIE